MRRIKPFVVGFVGWSGAGKTTLGVAVTAELTKLGYRCAALKDAHHGFDMDRPGKDSWRYREAGAREVIVRSDARWAMLVEAPEGRPPMEDLLSRFSAENDVIVVEGFKYEGDYPKIEVRRRENLVERGEHPVGTMHADVVAVAADDPAFAVPGLPLLPVDDVAAVSQFVLQLRERALQSAQDTSSK